MKKAMFYTDPRCFMCLDKCLNYSTIMKTYNVYLKIAIYLFMVVVRNDAFEIMWNLGEIP